MLVEVVAKIFLKYYIQSNKHAQIYCEKQAEDGTDKNASWID